MSRGWVFGAAGILVVAVGVGVWLLAPNGDPDPPGDVGPTTEELREAVRDARRAIALLENERLDEAATTLESLRERIPEDTFGTRNLSVTNLIRLESLPPGDPERDALVEATTELIFAWKEADDSRDAHIVAARIARAGGDEGTAIREYHEAIAFDPDDAPTHYELWRLGRDSRSDVVREETADALEKAQAADPKNVFMLLDVLIQRAEAESPDVADALDRLEDLLAPYVDGIKRRTRADVGEFIGLAREAIAAEDWRGVRRNVRILMNVTRPTSIAQSDRRRIDRNALEFVQTDFTAAFYKRETWEPETEPEPIAVTFEAGPPVGAAPVRALLLRDVNLDDRPDVVTLLDSTLTARTAPDELLEVAFDDVEYQGVLVADLDADADPPRRAEPGEDVEETCVVADLDFVLWGDQGLLVVENRLGAEGFRQLVPIPAAEVLPEAPELLASPISACTAADVDHDGMLDLVVATPDGLRILSSRGRLTFADITDRSSLEGANGSPVTALLPVDLDGDVDLDLVAIRADATGGVVDNLRHGSLRWHDAEGIPAGRGGVLADDVRHGWTLDVLTDDGLERATLPGIAAHGSAPTIEGDTPAGTLACDIDNDGREDRLAWGDFGVRLHRATAESSFTLVAEAFDAGSTTACDVSDLDGDGDLDVVTAGPEGVTTFTNEGGNSNGWLRIALKAQQIKGDEAAVSGRVNQHGVGSLISLKSGSRTFRRVVDRPWTHLGLGSRDDAEAVRVLWTNGVPFNLVGPSGNRAVCERQTLKGSCPYLYSWDGERITFVTDLLWAAPIGLQFAEDVHAMPREWEYLRVPGRFVAERDGFYDLRITEELWEVAYFDHVALIAVDHPADVDVFTNEKVGPPSIAEHRLHTVTTPHTPVSITNGRGHELLAELRERDGIYGRAYERRLRQGLVDEHGLEIDLGPEAASAERLTLFLTGWVFPSDTSLNVALSRDRSLPSPTPPRLEVLDEDGQWRTAIPFTGFPGGKTKTIAIDLSDVFEEGDDQRKVRFVTNMEFHWDHVFFTADDPDRLGDLVETTLELATAELRYRGFSREDLDPGLAPPSYDYADASTEPKWPAVDGRFTRFGDVRELVADTDDRLVVMGAGDEMRLRFRVPDRTLPDGWVRDFVLHCVGWDKDADLNTVTGQTVEPLPFRGMSHYPPPPGEAPQGSTADADRRHYHVRRQRWR